MTASVYEITGRERKSHRLAVVIAQLENEPTADEMAAWEDRVWLVAARIAEVGPPSPATRALTIQKVLARRGRAQRLHLADGFDGLPS